MTDLRDFLLTGRDPDLGTMSAEQLAADDSSAQWNKITEFFPAQDILADSGLTISQNAKLEFLTGFMKNQLLSLARSLAEEDTTKAELINSLNETSKMYLACKANYESDLAWVAKHLKAILAVWGKTNPILGAAEAQDMVYAMLASVSEKLEEFE